MKAATTSIRAGLMALACLPVAVHAVTVKDDAGNSVTLAKPAQRIISMAPHITELLFAAGGGDRVAGVMNYSDYPEAAKRLPLVGSDCADRYGARAVAAADLLWYGRRGTPRASWSSSKACASRSSIAIPQKLDEVATSLTRLGQLMGTEAVAQKAAQDYRQKIARLSATYARRPVVRVFYQIWEKPIFTLNGDHIASDAMRVCGGQNVFAALKVPAPTVSTEAVLQENPEAIVGGEKHDADPASISGSSTRAWRRSGAATCSCSTANCSCAPRRASPMASPRVRKAGDGAPPAALNSSNRS